MGVSTQLGDEFLGRGGRLTARLSLEEVKFQQDLEQALQVSAKDSSKNLTTKVEEDSDDDFEVVVDEKNSDKTSEGTVVPKEKTVVDMSERGEVVERKDVVEALNIQVGSEDLRSSDASANTVILQEEVKPSTKKTQVINSEEENEENKEKVLKETAAIHPKVSLSEKLKFKRKAEGVWIVGEAEQSRTRMRSGSGDSDRRTRKKPKRYVESSDSESEIKDGVIDSDVDSED